MRAAVVAAGPIANFILAIAIFTAIFTLFGERITPAKVDSVNPGSAAERAGFKPGDVVISIDGEKIESFGEMQRIVAVSADQPLQFVVDRGGAECRRSPRRRNARRSPTISATPCARGFWGLCGSNAPEDWQVKRHDPVTAFGLAVKECYFIVSQSLTYLWGVVTGRESADQLGGPIRIAQVSGQVASVSFVALINLAAVLSVSIGLLNSVPDTDARWRSSSLLQYRGNQGPSFE